MKSAILSLLVFNICFFCINGVEMISVTNNFSSYPSFCQRVASDGFSFQDFRRNRIYRGEVETVDYSLGLILAHEIREKYSNLLCYCRKICIEDEVGYPLSYTYSHIGRISPTVLRYIKVVGDLQREFGDLKNFNIVEIGGGFGGQCKIIHDIGGFKHYSIIDIPECIDLMKKYLSLFSIKEVECVNYKKITAPQKCDLLISNYAFSEIDREGQLFYIDMIISFARKGYMFYNNLSQVNHFSLREFVNILESKQKKVKVLHHSSSGIGDVVVWDS
jgi:hypothetical protein